MSIPIRPPLRDRQGDSPLFFCAQCGQEQYDHDPPAVRALCARCRRKEKKREEDAMTLYEIAAEYRVQALSLRTRIRELQAVRRTTDSPVRREELTQRLKLLGQIWRETRDLAAHLEHYYEGGRNGKYTL